MALYLWLPSYKVYRSFSTSDNLSRETELDIIVYDFWNIEEILSEIKDNNSMYSDKKNILVVNLYCSEWHLKHGKPFDCPVLVENPPELDN